MTSQPVTNMYSMLEFFVHWIKDGMYDFHHLPFSMKADLSESQLGIIYNLPENPVFKGMYVSSIFRVFRLCI